MRKDSIFVFGLSVFITAGIVGGAYYMSIVRPIEHASPGPRQIQTPALKSATGNVASPAYLKNDRTDRIIKCVDLEKGEFWTNAATCDGADLHNRLSYAKPVMIAPEPERHSNKNYIAPGEEASTRNTKNRTGRNKASYKPNLRLIGKSPPTDLQRECKFPVGRALEIERALSAADDPRESIWRENYCEQRSEVILKKCKLPSEAFYYSYSELCRADG
jgi:hypothetical protein